MRVELALAEAEESEVFRFAKWRFYPHVMTSAIKSGKLKPRSEEVDITAWAEKMLALKKGDKNHKPFGIMIGIDYDHLDSITPERLKQPIYIIEMKFGSLVIDGNHRVAKAFMDGKVMLPAYIISESQARKHKIVIG